MSFYTSDESAIGRIRNRETASAYRAQATATITPDFTRLLESYVNAYPHMKPGVMVALAKAGIDPTSEEAQQIADGDFEDQRRKGIFDTIGDVVGGAGRAVGKPLGVVGRAADRALGPVDESLAPAAKAAVRTGFVVLESPLQEVQTFVRAVGWAGVKVAEDQGDTSILNRLRGIVDPTQWDDQLRAIGEAYPKAGSSSLREVLTTEHGQKVDLGSGWLPGGEVEATVKKRANVLTLKVGDAQFGGPGNPSITPGRTVAATVTEPGSTQFNVVSGLFDAGVAWFGDPAAGVGALAKDAEVSSRIGRAARAFIDEEHGLAAAGRELATKPGLVETVDRSLQSRAAESLAGLVRGDRNTRNTVLPDLVDQWLTKGGQRFAEKVAGENDFYKLWEATGRKMPVELTRQLADAQTPQQVMDILRPALGTELRDAPEFLGFKAKRATRQGVRLFGDMPGAFIDPGDIDQAADQLDRWLRNAKVSPATRNAAVERLVRNPDRETMVTTLSDIMGDAAAEMATKIAPRNAGTAAARARSLSTMYAGDFDRVRNYFGDEIAENRRLNGIHIGGEDLPVQSPFLFTEYLNSVIPLPEAREIRRATSTLGKLVDNPFFERTVGALSGLQNGWKTLALARGAFTVRVVGEEQVRMAASGLDSLIAHPISAISALVADDSKVARMLGTGRIRQADVLGDDFFEGAEAASVELQRALNKGHSGWTDETIFDQTYSLFRREDEGYQRAWAQAIGELYTDPVARKVAQADGNLDEVKDWFWRTQGRKFRKTMAESHPELASQAGADRYIDTLWEGVQYRTQSDPTLLNAIATGSLNGTRIGKLNEAGRWNFDPAFLEHLDGTVGPEAVKGQRVLRQGSGSSLGEVWDNATGVMFNYLATKPTNYLSRSQSFRQRYWQRIEEMIPHMDDATRAKAIEGATGVVDKTQLARMKALGSLTERTIDDLPSADHLAKAFALDETKHLLYDLTDKGQFFDAFRLVFPFGEAWKEVLTRWAKIGAENPRVIRRGQQVFTGARGSGFFHKDVNGEEVFTYPFSRQLSKLAIGMPVDLNGRVAGLSLMSEVLPGVGPVVQIPAAAIVPDTPDWDWVKRAISPYGDPDTSDGFLEAFMPGYARNLRQFFQQGDDRLFANSVGASMDYLASTGEYDLSDPNELKRVKDDATDLARHVYLLRALTQFGSPTSPQPEYLVQDKNGDLDVARVVMQDFYEMQDKDYEGAVGQFLERYGTDLFLLTQGKSMSIPPVLPTTKTSADWERSHKDVLHDYALTWGLFAPVGDTDEFDYQAYTRQFARGDRVSLTPEQRMSLAQAKVGRYLYEQAKKRVSDKPNAMEREWLAAIKERIRMEYPGYGDMVPGLPARADSEAVMGELQQAAVDPRLRDTDQAKATRLYFTARDRALAYAQAAGVESLSADAATEARTWLARVGAAIARKYPAWQQTYDTVFAREVEAA